MAKRRRAKPPSGHAWNAHEPQKWELPSIFPRIPPARFDSVEAALEHARADEEATRIEVPRGSADGARFRFRVFDRDRVCVRLPGAPSPWVLTEWSARQLAYLCKFDFPSLASLSPDLCAAVLEERCKWTFGENPHVANRPHRFLVPVVHHPASRLRGRELRALNAIDYVRVSDEEILDILVKAALPELFNLYDMRRGDRMMVASFTRREELGVFEIDGEEFVPGFVVFNTEVGMGTTVLYRTMAPLSTGIPACWSGMNGLGAHRLRYRSEVGDYFEQLAACVRFVAEQQTCGSEAEKISAARDDVLQSEDDVRNVIHERSRAIRSGRMLGAIDRDYESAIGDVVASGDLSTWSAACKLAQVGYLMEHPDSVWAMVATGPAVMNRNVKVWDESDGIRDRRKALRRQA